MWWLTRRPSTTRTSGIESVELFGRAAPSEFVSGASGEGTPVDNAVFLVDRHETTAWRAREAMSEGDPIATTFHGPADKWVPAIV